MVSNMEIAQNNEISCFRYRASVPWNVAAEEVAKFVSTLHPDQLVNICGTLALNTNNCLLSVYYRTYLKKPRPVTAKQLKYRVIGSPGSWAEFLETKAAYISFRVCEGTFAGSFITCSENTPSHNCLAVIFFWDAPVNAPSALSELPSLLKRTRSETNRIHCQANFKVIDAHQDHVDKPGCKVQLWDYFHQGLCTGLNQCWTILLVSDDAYVIVQAASGLVLQPEQATRGSLIKLQEQTRKPEQLWCMERSSSGSWAIIHKLTGLALDADGGKLNQNGCPLMIWDKHTGLNQQWRIVVEAEL